MIKLDGARLRWSERDAHAMTRVVGPEVAVRGSIAAVASVAKAAKKYGVRLGGRVEALVRREHASVTIARKLLRRDDAAGHERYFPHQRVDIAYLRESGLPGYLLAHEPGVGKTLIALDWALRVLQAKSVLVITPNSAKDQWRDEIRRWFGKQRRIVIVRGTKAEQTRLASQRKDAIVIGHWESLVHARLGYLQREWDVVILDEAHNIGNRHAQRSDTAHALDARWRIALTGHPFTNDPSELWSILHFLYPDRYASFWAFWAMHVLTRPARFGGYDVLGPRRPKLLQWEIGAFTLRRTKAEVFASLPPITRARRTAELSTRGRREYEKLRKEFFAQLEGLGGPKTIVIPSQLARLTRLRQYLIDPGLVGAREPSAKYPIVLELLDELAGPPVIFTMFEQAARRLSHWLAKRKRRTLIISGKESLAERSRAKRRFLAGKLDALIVVTKAGGTALNLGGHGYVVHLDLPWNPRDFEQTEGRVDRPEEGTGRLVPTTAYFITVADSYEEKIEDKLQTKHEWFTAVFTVRQLKELFG